MCVLKMLRRLLGEPHVLEDRVGETHATFGQLVRGRYHMFLGAGGCVLDETIQGKFNRKQWCYVQDSGWDYCTREEGLPELFPSWSPSCSSGSCKAWLLDSSQADWWYNGAPSNEHATSCARPAHRTLGELTGSSDARPFCICEDGPRACEDRCSGRTCGIGGHCVSGQCKCGPGYRGARCDEREDSAPLTCEEKKDIGMDYSMMMFFFRWLYIPFLLFAAIMHCITPVWKCLAKVAATGAQYDQAEIQYTWGGGNIFENIICCPCKCLCSCFRQMLYCPCEFLAKCVTILGSCIAGAVCCTCSCLSLIILLVVWLIACVLSPILVYKLYHMERAILFCIGDVGFTELVIGPLLILAPLGIMMKMSLLGKMMQTKQAVIGLAALGMYWKFAAFLTLPGPTWHEPFWWLPISVHTVMAGSLVASICIGFLMVLIGLHVETPVETPSAQGAPFPTPEGIVKGKVGSRSISVPKYIQLVAAAIIFVKVAFSDVPAIAAPFVMRGIEGSPPFTEFVVYNAIYASLTSAQTLSALSGLCSLGSDDETMYVPAARVEQAVP